MSDMRKDFENDLHDKYNFELETRKSSQQTYRWSATEEAFKGFQAGRAHDIEGLIAEKHQHVNNIPIGRYDSTKGDSAYNWGKHYLAEFSEIIRKHFGKE